MISAQDLIQRFGEHELLRLTDKTASKQINADTVQAAIDDATAEAWSYLAGAGITQQPEKIPTVLKIKVCDMARWYLYENGVSDIVEKRYQAAIAWFKQVQKRPSMLGFDATDAAQTAADSRVVVLPNELEDWKDADTNKF